MFTFFNLLRNRGAQHFDPVLGLFTLVIRLSCMLFFFFLGFDRYPKCNIITLPLNHVNPVPSGTKRLSSLTFTLDDHINFAKHLTNEQAK